MDRALVVTDASPGAADLLRETGELAEGAGANVVVLALALADDDGSDVAEMRSALEAAGKAVPPDDVQTLRAFAEHVGDLVLGDTGVPFYAVGDVVDANRPSDRIIEIAESHNCDHIFISGKRRSPTGKAIFGDTTQSVILNFDGYVTVATE
jgi:nucleotide-binding universal stress UspA family protein